MEKFDKSVETILTNIQPTRILASNFLKRLEEERVLTEGLITSYSSSALRSEMFKKFKKYIVEVEDIPFNVNNDIKYKFGKPNTVTFLIQFPTEFKTHEKELQSILDLYGYFIVRQGFYSQNLDVYQFEPKYPIQILPEQLNGYKLFHITENNRVEKILQTGLTTKTSRTRFKHPANRIYLFATKNPKTYIPILKKELSEGRTIKDNKQTDMVVLEISLDALTDHIYLDESFNVSPNSYYAVFVLRPIRSEHITKTDY